MSHMSHWNHPVSLKMNSIFQPLKKTNSNYLLYTYCNITIVPPIKSHSVFLSKSDHESILNWIMWLIISMRL